MTILVVGGGGREHAIIWKLAQSRRTKMIYAAPGNPGIARHATCVPISAEDVTALARFAVAEKVDLVVVGPEVPLCMGITDLLEQAGIPVFGPSAFAAQIEGSKVFSKRLMRTYNIPTAAFGNFDAYGPAVEYARSLGTDMWIKASGLAAGKGAVYAADPDHAAAILDDMMNKRIFGDSGESVVIEENMTGEEASIFAICDGSRYRLLVPSQDHKRAHDNDEGPNTGGMGAYAPAPVASPGIIARVEREIIQPTLDGMTAEGHPYKGILYAGVMVTADGPKVVEYNCRFGDPETQAVLPLLDNDMADLLEAAAHGSLGSVEIKNRPGFALCVVMASGGYPGHYDKDLPVKGLDDVAGDDGVMVFHAGTAYRGDSVVTAGGRVFGVTGWGDDFETARALAYETVGKISFPGAFCRTDIGMKARGRLAASE